MEYERFERYAWDSAEEAFKDLGVDGTKHLVLVDSDCIVYPTAFSRITMQGVEATQQAAVNKLTALLNTLPKGEDYKIVQVFTSSGSPKYRDQFIKQVPYKANRKTSTAKPPEYVKEITEALTEHSVSIYCDPLVGEADDTFCTHIRHIYIFLYLIISLTSARVISITSFQLGPNFAEYV